MFQYPRIIALIFFIRSVQVIISFTFSKNIEEFFLFPILLCLSILLFKKSNSIEETLNPILKSMFKNMIGKSSYNTKDDYSRIDNLYVSELGNLTRVWVYMISVTGTHYNDMIASSKLRNKEEVILLPSPSKYDLTGVKVLTRTNKHIGWLPADSSLKEEVFQTISSGGKVLAKVHAVEKYNDRIYINLSIAKYDILTREEKIRLEKRNMYKEYEKKYPEMLENYNKIKQDVSHATREEKGLGIEHSINLYNHLILQEVPFYIPYYRMAIYYRKKKDKLKEVEVLQVGIENISNTNNLFVEKEHEIKALVERLEKLKSR